MPDTQCCNVLKRRVRWQNAFPIITQKKYINEHIIKRDQVRKHLIGNYIRIKRLAKRFDVYNQKEVTV